MNMKQFFLNTCYFICSINHEQLSDDRTLLNMYFNKYVNLHLCRFF